MTWSPSPPTQPGLYWYREDDPAVPTRLAELVKYSDGSLRAFDLGNDMEWQPEQPGIEWHDEPVTPPAEDRAAGRSL